MGTKADRQGHAKRNNPSFAIERYVKTTNTGAPKLPAPLSKEKPLAIKNDTAKKIKKYGELAETVKKVGSTFGIRRQEIMEAVDAGNIDHAVLQFQRQAYSTIVNLIPVAEKEYKKSKRDHQAYVLNALISQGRELAADLMASGDRAQLADVLIREVLEPTFKALLQQMMQEQLQLKVILGDKLKPAFVPDASREMDDSLKRLAGCMTELFKSTSLQINKKLLGE